jgi:hypothetical protein
MSTACYERPGMMRGARDADHSRARGRSSMWTCVGPAPWIRRRPSASVLVIIGLAAGRNWCSFEYLRAHQPPPPSNAHGSHAPAGILNRGRARRLHAHARGHPEQRGDEEEERGARPRARRGAREARVRGERARLVRDLGEVCAALLLRGGELAHGRGVLQERGGGGRGRRGGARAQLDGGLGHGGDGDEQEEQARAAGSGGPDPARRRDA